MAKVRNYSDTTNFLPKKIIGNLQSQPSSAIVYANLGIIFEKDLIGCVKNVEVSQKILSLSVP